MIGISIIIMTASIFLYKLNFGKSLNSSNNWYQAISYINFEKLNRTNFQHICNFYSFLLLNFMFELANTKRAFPGQYKKRQLRIVSDVKSYEVRHNYLNSEM